MSAIMKMAAAASLKSLPFLFESKLLTKEKPYAIVKTDQEGTDMEEQGFCGKLIKQIHDELRKNANNAER